MQLARLQDAGCTGISDGYELGAMGRRCRGSRRIRVIWSAGVRCPSIKVEMLASSSKVVEMRAHVDGGASFFNMHAEQDLCLHAVVLHGEGTVSMPRRGRWSSGSALEMQPSQPHGSVDPSISQRAQLILAVPVGMGGLGGGGGS